MIVDGELVKMCEIGNVVVFLLSNLLIGMIGDVVYVDKGVYLS